MKILLYDGTFDGLLSAIFDSYDLKVEVGRFLPEFEYAETLFEQPITCIFDKNKADRVKKGLIKKTSKRAFKTLYHSFLSEEEDIEMRIFKYVKSAMSSLISIEDNFLDDNVLYLNKVNKKIGREVHRMHAFVRFQLTKDDIYYSVIEPDFNVLPLIGDHFEKRYPAQQWLIYDAKRHYGIFYDLKKIDFITFAEENPLQLRQLPTSVLDDAETGYQVAWKHYFDSVNIPERKNMKLHLQHVPRRYWKYLSEKNTELDVTPNLLEKLNSGISKK